MAQKIKQGNIFGRIGSGIGKGLAEQIPQEIQRNRMVQGLQDLSQQSDLTPFEQFSRLASIPGITPQMIQSGSELLRQQAMAKGLEKYGQDSKPIATNNEGQPVATANPFKDFEKPAETNQGDETKGITTTAPVQATINPYIPPTQEQFYSKAADLHRKHPELFSTRELAEEGAKNYFLQQEAQSRALQGQREGQQNVQGKLQEELRKAATNAGINVQGGTQVPDNVYQSVENKALDAVNSGKMTELQAAQYYKKELDTVARQYQSLDTVGSIGYALRDTKDIKRNFRDIREGFKERNDLQNFADSLIAKNGLSASKAYYLAYPTSENKELNNEIVKLKEINPEINLKRGFVEKQIDPDYQKQQTLSIAPKLAKAMGKEGSPLAIAEELNARGYDGTTWLDYVSRNKKSLDLSTRQADELTKPTNTIPTINDYWLFYMSGLEKLMEQ